MKVLILVAALLATAAAIAVPSDGRIAGGTNALMAQFPYQVAVRHSGTFICGGTLIGLRWVLTSGECVWEYPGTEYAYTVLVGGLTISGNEPGRESIGVQSVYVHPNFKTKDTLYYYNVGLMYLSYPVTLGSTVQLAQLPVSGTVVPNGINGELAGWGGTNSRVSNNLQWATMTTIPVEDCTSAVGGGAAFTAAQICTYAYPGPSACWYDHGGALVQKSSSGTLILGVTAYAGCLDPSHPTIYTNVGFKAHRDWIELILTYQTT